MSFLHHIKKTSDRWLSLDVFRGFTIIGMIFLVIRLLMQPLIILYGMVTH